jgi:hypothetical protein
MELTKMSSNYSENEVEEKKYTDLEKRLFSGESNMGMVSYNSYSSTLCPNRAFKIGIIETTLSDVKVVDSNSNKFLGRPYITLLIDAYSRKVLSTHFDFVPPSNKSLERVLYECVRKHSKIPNTIVLEGYRGYCSKELEELIVKFNFTLKYVPKLNNGFKSTLEKVIDSNNKKLPSELLGKHFNVIGSSQPGKGRKMD